jgi:hypothetical protein
VFPDVVPLVADDVCRGEVRRVIVREVTVEMMDATLVGVAAPLRDWLIAERTRLGQLAVVVGEDSSVELLPAAHLPEFIGRQPSRR